MSFTSAWRRFPFLRGPRPAGVALRVVVATVVAALVWTTPLRAQVKASYLYTLSNFEGRTAYSWARVSIDQARDETYVIYGNLVRVYNASGMETYAFGDDLDVGLLADLAVNDDGEVILLSHEDARPRVTRCDFRGVPVGAIEVTGLPAGLEFTANRMVHRNGLLYFATTSALRVIVTDAAGAFREYIDLGPLLDLDEKQRDGAEMTGFSVDAAGNLYFTIAVAFKAFRLSPDRKLEAFGRPGSSPGRFAVVAGIAADRQGRVLVVDKLKCVIMVFDREFRFLTEFGYRGNRNDNLIAPDEIALDARDRAYVTQGRRRGISVFALAEQ